MASSGFSRRRNLLGLDRGELEQIALDCGEPRFRGRQIYRAIYARRLRDLSAATDLGLGFRRWLSGEFRVTYPEPIQEFLSSDGAVRYLLRLEDGECIEAVYMPEENRITLCLSSQVGCAVDCRFCFTGLLGVKRNLSAGEIIGQILAVLEAQRVPRGLHLNVVFMGMGEPLLNYAQTMKAVRIMADPEGLSVPPGRITISTAGIIPRIHDLASESVRPRLAVSLNASTDEQRSALMPLNRKYRIQALLDACRSYPLRPRERLTFEYVLLDGINDSNQDALRVAELLKDIRAKVNLIPYNPGPELPYRPPSFERVLAFQQVLEKRHMRALIRLSRGQDVRAACGQLSLAGLNADT